MKITLDNAIGAVFLGVSTSYILVGIAVVQTYSYYLNFPKDWIFQKISVGILIILATFNTIFTLHVLYYYLIMNFGNLGGLETIVWSFKLQVLVNVLLIIFVQGLYATRVWKLGNHFSRVWATLAGLVVTGGWAIGLLLVVKLYRETSFATLGTMSPVIYAAFIASTTIDAVIASSMCYYLNLRRSSFIRTNKIVTVMRYVLITGFLTSACSLSGLITYATMPHNMVFIGINFLLPNLYINSYIAMLNARKSLNEQETTSINISKAFKMGSNLTIRTDIGNLHSVGKKRSRDGIPLSATRFTSNFLNTYDPEQNIPSKMALEIAIHRTEERHWDQYGRGE